MDVPTDPAARDRWQFPPGLETTQNPADESVPSSTGADDPPVSVAASRIPTGHRSALDDFSRRWLCGECASVEDYIAGLGPVDADLAVELIYREYCLEALDQREPDPADYLTRFPEYAPGLKQRLAVHDAGMSVSLRSGADRLAGAVAHGVGDQIGPYVLTRELGRGASARVFLAEERDLENRLVVVKLTTRPTMEPWLLARTSHDHIVEILSYAMVDDGDCQLICMPFLGGATLAAVLERRRSIPRPANGRSALLADLDAVAAREYVGLNPANPSREILGRLTVPQAVGWITARLADALDHAFAQKVVHGDLKPSNILLAADGTPMLLDFNMAQDWSAEDDLAPPEDLGGTLAYMSPERLRAFAAASGGAGSACAPHEDSSPSRRNSEDGYHRADIYALGMVLLEAVTGAPPPTTAAQPGPRRSPIDLAVELAAYRERGAAALVQAATSQGRTTIPPTLRAILLRCLAPRPEDRYRRALELAEDLNRWRADRPLAYAAEPFWTATLGRHLRRRRRLLTAAALVFAVGLTTLALAFRHSHATLEALALHKLARNLDDPVFPAFQSRHSGAARLPDPDDPQAQAAAVRVLRDYDVLGNRRWREQPEFRNLPPEDREDLELFLMEQALRFCHPRVSQARSPQDLEWARVVLDHIDTDPPLRAVAALRQRIDRRLGRPAPAPSAAPGRVPRHESPGSRSPSPISPDLDEYLLGVAAELDEAGPARPALASQAGVTAARGSHAAQAPPGGDPSRALRHYEAILRHNPETFSAHYRAAVACFALRRWADAADHLEPCIRRRSSNAILRRQRATCLAKLGDLDRAARECDQAIALAPELAESYRTRAFIRAWSGQVDGLGQDLDRFDRLERSQARTFFHSPPAQELGDLRTAVVPTSLRILDLEPAPSFLAGSDDPLVQPDPLDHLDLDTRAFLAQEIGRIGADSLGDPSQSTGSPLGRSKKEALALAAREFDRVLAVEPDHLRARLARMAQALGEGRLDEARQDLDVVMNSPDLPGLLRDDPDYIRSLARQIDRFARHGLMDPAVNLYRKLTVTCWELGLPRGPLHYFMARARCAASASDPGQLSKAAEDLRYALVAHPRFREWYRTDHDFDPVRIRLDAAMERLVDPATSY